MITDLELDLSELKELAMRASRPNVQMMLGGHISTLKTQLQAKQAKQREADTMQSAQTQAPHKYQILTKYAWDQQGVKVKLYFDLPNIGSECTTDQVEFKCTKQSVEVKVHGYRGGHHLFAVKRLCSEIDPDTSKYLLKTNSLCIILVKKDKAAWAQIAYKEDKFKPQEEEKKEDDPQASIMNLMKKMYNQGDANMKKTIAQAWTKANDKKGGKDLDL